MQRRIIIDNDGGDVLYCAGPSYEEFTASRMQGLVGTGATTLFYTPVSSGFSVFTHNTKVGSVRTLHEARHPRNITADLIAKGTDCLHEAARFCRSNGMEIFFGMRMNDTHDGTGAFYSDGMLAVNRFKREHPECLLGTRTEKPRHGAWTAVNYLCDTVWEMALRLVEEVCQGYDVDGVHLDFFRHPVFFPSPSRGEPATAEELAAMTGLMRGLRAMMRAEGARRGKPFLLSIRVPDSVPYARFLGLAIDEWLAEGLVDLLCTASYLQLNRWQVSAALGHAAGVPVYPSLDEPRIRDEEANRLRTEPAGMRARCANAFAAGCDGVLLFNYIFDDVKGAKERYDTVRDIADPQRLRRKARRYFASFLGVGAVAGGAPDHTPYQHAPVLNPAVPLCLAGAGEIEVEVGDPSGPGARVMLWLDGPADVRVSLNGRAIGRGTGPLVCLPVEAVPQGINRIEVEVDGPICVRDAAIEIQGEGKEEP